jgi:hypothetical protein
MFAAAGTLLFVKKTVKKENFCLLSLISNNDNRGLQASSPSLTCPGPQYFVGALDEDWVGQVVHSASFGWVVTQLDYKSFKLAIMNARRCNATA